MINYIAQCMIVVGSLMMMGAGLRLLYLSSIEPEPPCKWDECIYPDCIGGGFCDELQTPLVLGKPGGVVVGYDAPRSDIRENHVALVAPPIRRWKFTNNRIPQWLQRQQKEAPHD